MERKSSLRYIERALRLAAQDPVGAIGRIRAGLDKRRDRFEWATLGISPEQVYEVDPEWEQTLHHLIDAPWPCATSAEFDHIWSDVAALPRGVEMGHGEDTQAQYLQRAFDATPAFARAVYCVATHLRPTRTVETGVARGITTRLLLEALDRNGEGRLWSIDLPHPDTVLNDQIGIAVPPSLRDRWELRLGSSVVELPPLLDELGAIDLFVHDSAHTRRNVDFELHHVWPKLRPGGVVLLDDVHLSLGFLGFLKRSKPGGWVVGSRMNSGGLWGLALKVR